MSRGKRDAALGILKSSMRDNYTEHGVDEYYKKVGASYRNPHFPGVKGCLFLWLNRWWKMRQPLVDGKKFYVFDMACGSGEATESVLEWWSQGRNNYTDRQRKRKVNQKDSDSDSDDVLRPQSAAKVFIPPDMPVPCILAADPYTSQAFHTRTSLYAHPLSFRDIAEGQLPEIASKPVGASKPINPYETPSPEGSVNDHTPTMTVASTASSSTEGEDKVIEMVICSFALHLIEKPSELFALLRELSTKARWLVVIAPHKRPEIKDGWGWVKWDVETWGECRMGESTGELLQDRVHCRVYHSMNY